MRLWIVLITLTICQISFADNLSEKKQSLEKAKEKIQTQKQQLKKLKGKEVSILKTLHSIDQKKSKLSGQRRQIEKSLANLETEIQETTDSLHQRNEFIDQRSESMAKQLRSMYMYGEMNVLKLLFSSSSLEDIGQKQYLVKRWVERDREKINQFRIEATKLSTAKQKLELQRQEKAQKAAELARTMDDISKEQNAKKKLLTMVKTEEDYYQKSIQELEEASKNLETLIRDFKKAPVVPGSAGPSRFAQMRGRLVLPVIGPIEKKYGSYVDPKLKVTLNHKGIDIRAKEGADVAAIYDGRVVYADWFSGYGKVVIIDHDSGYFSLYAHLSEIHVNVSQAVTVGDAIGQVGDTESLKGDYLYFELREKGVTVNPLPWFDRH